MSVIKLVDLDLKGKRVFIRADLNVPVKDGKVTSDARITASMATINHCLKQGAKVMVTSHLGRPEEGQWSEENSLKPVADNISARLNKPVRLIRDWVDGGFNVADGELVVLENCRINKGEKKNVDETAQKYAKLCDVFVMDAFGTAHRAEASTHGIAKYAPVACAGILLTEELDALTKALLNPARPMVAIVGASKVSTNFSGRLTEAHAGTKAEGGALSTLRRQAKNLFATGEEGRVAWREGSLQWQTRADDLGYWEWRTNVPLPPAALGAGWHTIQSDPVASSAGSAGTPGVPPGHAAGLLVHDPRNTSGLISDIDDTILETQVLDKPRLLKNTLTIPPESRQAVAGMAALYQRLASQLPDPAAAPLFYLSASPRQITDSVRRFLAHNQFPRGVLQLREVSTQARSRDPLTDTQAYKIQRIQAILDAFPDVRFVLVGDDAEHDPETYAHFQQTQPQRIHSVWIRRIHPDPARPRHAGLRDLAQLLAGAQPCPISAPRAD